MSQARIEELVTTARFNMRKLCDGVWDSVLQDAGCAAELAATAAKLKDSHARRLRFALLRHVFLIELVKTPKIETTKVRYRWTDELRHDQRYASYEDCLRILNAIAIQLASGWLDVEDNLNLVKVLFDHGQVAYEFPLDYAEVPGHDDPHTLIHQPGNLVLMCTPEMQRAARLRKHLISDAESPDSTFFSRVLDNKVQIKTYLTDRVLTGAYKTNREKRWEVHPRSVHFATRRSCMDIEHSLLGQICHFERFPPEARQQLIENGLLEDDPIPFRCPITLIPLSFEDLQEEIANPTHGKSAFQVGHLNPLKLGDEQAGAAGHTAANISWISADGNRIQGSMGLDEVRALLRTIVQNYEDTGLA